MRVNFCFAHLWYVCVQIRMYWMTVCVMLTLVWSWELWGCFYTSLKTSLIFKRMCMRGSKVSVLYIVSLYPRFTRAHSSAAPLLTCLGSQSAELVYTCLQHVQLLLAKDAGSFADSYQTFYCRYCRSTWIQCIVPLLLHGVFILYTFFILVHVCAGTMILRM